MEVVTKLDEMGKPAWIALTVLGFVLWWPAGLALLTFLALSGRLRGMACGGAGRWYNTAHEGGRWGRGCGGRHRGYRAQPSGNRAFDEYREETLRRLEEEQKEFQEYLERLRQARDKSEFDQFMAERRNRSTPTDTV
jgi:hypothetical protein